MRIGELEKRSGASRHTLRYYETLGFIQQAQGMGFSLGEISEILKARREQQLDCAQGAELVSRKLVEVEQKLADLQQLRNFLRSEKQRLENSAAEQAAIQTIMTTR